MRLQECYPNYAIVMRLLSKLKICFPGTFSFKTPLIALLALILIVPSFAAHRPKKPSWCNTEGYVCLKVKRNQTWENLFPDDREREIVMRINHTNNTLYPGMRLKIPKDLEVADLLDHAPFPRQVDAPQEKMVVFDPNQYAWGAYDPDGNLVRWGPATGGADWCPDIDEECRTKAGEFRIYSLGGSSCISRKFPLPDGGAPMPYCMFFNGGQAFHGSPGGVMKGNQSHGCVRMFVEDAEWLRYDFVEPPDSTNDYQGTKVVVLPYASSSSHNG